MILVNGDPMPWSPGLTVAEILRLRKFIFPMLIVQVNGKLVKRPAYAQTEVPDSADVQVIHMMSGG
jgi:thiamine biosynthesis protein ThiS